MSKKIWYRFVYVVVLIFSAYFILLLIKPSLYHPNVARVVFGLLVFVGICENLREFIKKQK